MMTARARCSVAAPSVTTLIVAGEVDRGHVVGDQLGAEALGLLAQVVHQVRAHDAVGEAGEVLDVGGVHQGAAGGHRALEHQRCQVGPRGVDGGGVAGRAGADDDHVADVVHVGREPFRLAGPGKSGPVCAQPILGAGDSRRRQGRAAPGRSAAPWRPPASSRAPTTQTSTVAGSSGVGSTMTAAGCPCQEARSTANGVMGPSSRAVTHSAERRAAGQPGRVALGEQTASVPPRRRRARRHLRGRAGP